MPESQYNVGVLVLGALTSARALSLHADLLAAYADGTVEDDREAYLSHFVFGEEMKKHYHTNRRSVAAFAGPCRCRYLTLDIDRPDLAEALTDARKLVAFLHERYPELEGSVPIYFSGGKGFHVKVELAHEPSPSDRFHRVARTFAETVAAQAGVRIDSSVYDANHLIRLPNTRHPRSGLYKRRLDAEALFGLGVEGIREHARHPAGDGLPTVRSCPALLESDWQAAERDTARVTETLRTRQAAVGINPDIRAPRYFVDFLRFGVEVGERHPMLFRCAAWLTEQGAPPSLVVAILTEPGLDVGLKPTDVDRQIECGINHAKRQQVTIEQPIDNGTEEGTVEREAIIHEGVGHSPEPLDFPFGALTPPSNERGVE